MDAKKKQHIKSDALGTIEGTVKGLIQAAGKSLGTKCTTISQEYQELLAFGMNELADLITEVVVLQNEVWEHEQEDSAQ